MILSFLNYLKDLEEVFYKIRRRHFDWFIEKKLLVRYPLRKDIIDMITDYKSAEIITIKNSTILSLCEKLVTPDKVRLQVLVVIPKTEDILSSKVIKFYQTYSYWDQNLW